MLNSICLSSISIVFKNKFWEGGILPVPNDWSHVRKCGDLKELFYISRRCTMPCLEKTSEFRGKDVRTDNSLSPSLARAINTLAIRKPQNIFVQGKSACYTHHRWFFFKSAMLIIKCEPSFATYVELKYWRRLTTGSDSLKEVRIVTFEAETSTPSAIVRLTN